MNAHVQPHVFLSYTRRDMEIMHRVRDTLRDEGLNVWVDEGIEPGTPLWDRAVEDALKAAGCMLVILTPNVIDSKGVRDEIHFAGMHRVRIFTVLAQGEPSASVPYTLSGNQFVDIRVSYTTNMARLITAIQKHLGVEGQTSATANPDVSPITQSESKETSSANRLMPLGLNSSLNSVIRNGLKYILSLSSLFVGGFSVGALSGSLAFNRYYADKILARRETYLRSAQASLIEIVISVILFALIFPKVRDWLLGRKIGKSRIFGLIIFSTIFGVMFTAHVNGLEGILFAALALGFAVFILPALFLELWAYFQKLSRRLLRK